MWAALAESLPDGALVWVSSSMPIRDVESFFPSVANPIRLPREPRRERDRRRRVLGRRRGARPPASRAWLLTGELALIHDVGGLLAALAGRSGS